MSRTNMTALAAALALAVSPAFAQGANTGSQSNAGTGMAAGQGAHVGKGTSAIDNKAPGYKVGADKADTMGSDNAHSSMGDMPEHRGGRVSSSHHGTSSRGGTRGTTSADHSADQLNAQSLSSIEANRGPAGTPTATGGVAAPRSGPQR